MPLLRETTPGQAACDETKRRKQTERRNNRIAERVTTYGRYGRLRTVEGGYLSRVDIT